MGAGVSNEPFKDIDLIKKEIRAVFDDLYEQAKPEEGDILVVGCSSSEVASHKLGTFSSKEIGQALVSTLYDACKEKGLHLAAQCCEHLNRALVLEKSVAKERGYEIVSVVPHLKAGGSFATAAHKILPEAVAVEHIKAELGIDIGDTLIGMHLKDVAVPVRVNQTEVGNAHIVCARTRPKYIGGERALYN